MKEKEVSRENPSHSLLMTSGFGALIFVTLVKNNIDGRYISDKKVGGMKLQRFWATTRKKPADNSNRGKSR